MNSKKILATGLLGLALVTLGCAARTGPIRGEAAVQGDSTSASGRSQVNTDTQTEENRKKSSSGGAVSGSVTGSGTGSVSGSGSVSGAGS